MTHVMTPLKRLLVARGMDYRALAEATGYSLGTVRNIAAGFNCSDRCRQKIEVIVGAHIDWPKLSTRKSNKKHGRCSPVAGHPPAR